MQGRALGGADRGDRRLAPDLSDHHLRLRRALHQRSGGGRSPDGRVARNSREDPPDAAALREAIGEVTDPQTGSNAFWDRLAGNAGRSLTAALQLAPALAGAGSPLGATDHEIPGEFNVWGASFFGSPLVNEGFNRHVAWSHTVSTAWRFTPFQLKLVPGNPTSYVLDGQDTQGMTSRTVSVKVRTQGGLETRRHTFWYSRLGPSSASPGSLLLERHQRLRARGRQRRQPAGRQRLVRHRPRSQRRRPGPGAIARPGGALGQHDRRRRPWPGALPGRQRRPPRRPKARSPPASRPGPAAGSS